jgi:hypothetical protein
MNSFGAGLQYGFVLSDPITQIQLNAPKVAFNVKENRDYGNAIALVSEEYCDLTYMVVTKTKITTFLPRVYYLDSEGTLGGEDSLSMLLNESGSDLANHVEATIQGTKKDQHIVHWHKKGRSVVLNKKHVIAEYITKNDKIGYDLCLIDWKGNNRTGKIEVWYGAKVKRKEVRVFQFPKISAKIL